MTALLPNCSYLLVTHGSRDPRPQQAAERLAALVCDRLSDQRISDRVVELAPVAGSAIDGYCTPGCDRSELALAAPLVGTAVLECAPQPLHQQIIQFAQQSLAIGLKALTIVPLFLLPGVHVMEDIPAEVAIAQQALGEFRIQVLPYLGQQPGLLSVLAAQFAEAKFTHSWTDTSSAVRILFAHGSRRSGGNEIVEQLAKTLGAIPAYWSVAPSLNDRLEPMIQAGATQIVVLPYLLSAGGITDEIAQQLEQYRQRNPQIQVHLLPTLDAQPGLVDCLVDCLVNCLADRLMASKKPAIA